MKRLFVTFSVLFTVALAAAQTPTLQWARSFGSALNDFGKSTATDNAGNLIVGGDFSNTIDFDPGPGVFNLISKGQFDTYILKLDANGNFLWAASFGDARADLLYAVSIDNNNNVYATGSFSGTVDFDPGPGVYNLSTATPLSNEAFILKLDANGQFLWAKQLAGISAFAAEPDAGGNLCMAGSFEGQPDFDPGPAVFTIAQYGFSGTYDGFVMKLDAAGNFAWAKQLGGTQMDDILDLAVDAAGNVITVGHFRGTGDFDPGPATYNFTASGSLMDIFISKLNSAGNFVWALHLGGVQEDYGWGIDTDPAGNLVLDGVFFSPTDFDPGAGNFTLTPSPSGDAFVLKLDAAGNFAWARQLGGTSADIGRSITTDAAGNIYALGYFEGTGDFDPGAGTFNLTSSGFSDVFITKLNSSGNFVWAVPLGSATNYDWGFDIKVDAAGKVYSVGHYWGTVDFDPGPAVYNLTMVGLGDAYVQKLSQCTNITYATLNVNACGSYTLNGQTYSASGVYTQTLTNAGGCDSILTLNLAIGGSTTTVNATACDSYTWEGNTYTASGLYTVTFTGADGCDSVRKLNLTIKNSVTTNVNAAICEGQSYAGYTTTGIYTNVFTAANGCDSTRILNLTVKPVPRTTVNAVICEGQSVAGHNLTGTYIDTFPAANGCDSIRTLNLQVNPRKQTAITAAICAGQTYFAGGALQTLPGIYRDTLQTWLGCDSVVVTTLTVNPKPVPQLGADGSLCGGSTQILNPGSFSNYLWQNGSTQPTFTVNSAGTYWVRVTDANNCTAADTLNVLAILPEPANFLRPTDSICAYGQYTAHAIGSFNNYLWSTGSTQNSITTRLPGLYWLRVTDNNGCVGTDTLRLVQKACATGVFFPSAFTPNGDGVNDRFKAECFGNAISYRLQVFDRFGNRVFETTNPDQGWDGRYNGKTTITTTFVWQCSYRLEGGEPVFRKGTVILIR